MESDLADKLDKFKLSEKEEEDVELLVDNIAPGLRECQLSLIGQSYGDKRNNFNGLQRTLNNIWITRKPFKIRPLGFNKYQFMFELEEDRDRILQGKSWTFDGQYLLLKLWHPQQLDFSEEEKVIKVWVHLINLLLHWTIVDSAWKIGKKLGKVLDVQVPRTGNNNIEVTKF
ncbi:Unknown protein [Striga hermonthica]|uniref:DUF4283 domain-containing protein n=1 Tax=Striga hermonthica TaxID=68872 RepID=A0A9N7R1F5_STRHE|nr:Unknown protein [Striga hermonthica]